MLIASVGIGVGAGVGDGVGLSVGGGSWAPGAALLLFEDLELLLDPFEDLEELLLDPFEDLGELLDPFEDFLDPFGYSADFVVADAL